MDPTGNGCLSSSSPRGCAEDSVVCSSLWLLLTPFASGLCGLPLFGPGTGGHLLALDHLQELLWMKLKRLENGKAAGE